MNLLCRGLELVCIGVREPLAMLRFNFLTVTSSRDGAACHDIVVQLVALQGERGSVW